MATVTMQPIGPAPAAQQDSRGSKISEDGGDLSDVDSGWVILGKSDIVPADLAAAAAACGGRRLSSSPTIPAWARWVLGGVVYTVVPFYKRVRNVEDSTVGNVETAVEVIEHIAEVTEKLAANVADQLPEDGSLQKAVEKVEYFAEIVDKDAEKVEAIVKKLSMYSSKKNRGLAFVTMGSEEEALSAISNLNLTILNDRTIKVDFAKPRKKQPIVPSAPMQKYVVFVGNLTWRVRSRHLRELFASTPGVQSVEVIFHTTTPRRSAGYAFVSFSSKEEAETALSTFNGKELMGRSITVMFKEENAKKNKSSDPEEEELEAESSEQSDS